MPTWITHLMIADRVLDAVPQLDRHGFCVGSIAPDCNVENEDWTQFIPPKKTTHWMSDDRKIAADSDRFFREFIDSRRHEIGSEQELSFLFGYYAHLVADAEFQRITRDAERVAASWKRIREHPALSGKAEGMPETWESVKKLIDRHERLKDLHTVEAEYLEEHPESGYLTEIMGLKSFPDYIDYLPKGAIVRKIGIMGSLPVKESGIYPFVAMTREEFSAFLDSAEEQIVRKLSAVRQ